jgi:hypothetical protein
VPTFQTVLSAFAAALIAFVGRPYYIAMTPVNNSKATAMAVIDATLYRNLFSPWSWLLAVFCFLLFFATSRIANKPLRILFFWTPTITMCMLLVGIVTLYAYIWIYFRSG